MATGEAHNSRLRMVITVVIGLLIAIVPLPDTLRPWRPDFLLLLVIYWSLSAPRIAGLSFAWLSGLLIDVLSGTILGQHALAFLLVAFLTHKFQLRMRIFPIWHQTLTVFMLLALYQFVVFWIDGIVGPGITTWLRWLPVLTGALAWPILVAVLDTLNRRRS